MKIEIFIPLLGFGGTEKAAFRWAAGLKKRHELSVMSLEDGPMRNEFARTGIEVRVVEKSAEIIAEILKKENPDVIHAHMFGFRGAANVLGHALQKLPKRIPVVQTNVFGRLENPQEDGWTDYRMFISYTSAGQAARRAGFAINASFFRRADVAVYPLCPPPVPDEKTVREFRASIGVHDDEVLFGRFSRPDIGKWIDLPLDGFIRALNSDRNIKLLLCEPPPSVAQMVREKQLEGNIVVLQATTDEKRLNLIMASIDVVLHGSKIGESFGYGIAEPMLLGKPAIANSVPWNDQAQIELVRPKECGYIASTPEAIKRAILALAKDNDLRKRMGANAKEHIARLTDPDVSIRQLEKAFYNALAGRDNSEASECAKRVRSTMAYVDRNQLGSGLSETASLLPGYVKHEAALLRRKIKRIVLSR